VEHQERSSTKRATVAAALATAVTSGARATLAMPRRSSRAVRSTSTRLSVSSTQSTGTSWMRRPLRWAASSSSVSKNQAWSSTTGSRACTTPVRPALKPHWASVKRARMAVRSSRL
jgi:hypothetical protein